MSSKVPPCTALVTGASRGIGRAIARALALRGARIALHYHTNRRAAQEARAELTGDGHALFAADLADPAQVAGLWREASVSLGPIDVLVNNAAVYLAHPPLEAGYEAWRAAWRRTLATNLEGPANLSVLAAQSMATRDGPRGPAWGRGRIVNVSSRGAFRGEPEAPAYGASKAGLNALSQSLAKALAPRAVYVYCLAPGWVETEMAASHLAGPGGPEILAQHPLNRVTTPDEVAAVAVYCALDAPPAMTGSLIDVNGASYLRT